MQFVAAEWDVWRVDVIHMRTRIPPHGHVVASIRGTMLAFLKEDMYSCM
jgi:hypothetical protein